ncbi:response regulator containing CheY-like receiver domain and AraC-type DNA-binding domain [Thiovulum sp. ES]|nr:response regulator containing CheY-like receiver domain and AraC-type DNA-binding domain [Thiovulum sp. ES]
MAGNSDLIKISEETKKLTAMVVEDEKEANQILTSTFSNFFSHVYSSFNGKEGLEVYKEYKPDVVFVDIIMDGMDGIALSRKIREIEPRQIIVIISASNDITKISETIEIGVNSFIQKPVDTSKTIELLSAIVDIVKKRKKVETKTFSISLPIDIYEKVSNSAKDESVSKNAIVIRALREFYHEESSPEDNF